VAKPLVITGGEAPYKHILVVSKLAYHLLSGEAIIISKKEGRLFPQRVPSFKNLFISLKALLILNEKAYKR